MPGTFEIDPIKDLISNSLSDTAVTVVNNILDAFQEEAPVDTGNLVANFIPHTQFHPAPPQRVLNTRQAREQNAAISRSIQRLAIDDLNSYDISQGAIIITNNTPYLEEVDERTQFINRALLTAGVF